MDLDYDRKTVREVREGFNQMGWKSGPQKENGRVKGSREKERGKGI